MVETKNQKEKEMSRKVYMLLSLLAVLAFALTACGAPVEPVAEEPEAEAPVAEEEEAPAAEPVTITWWHIQTEEHQVALWQGLADEYMAAHPNVTVEITALENEAFKTKLTTVMQSNDPPDIFQSWGGGVMNEYAEAGLLKDITADLAADGWGDTFAAGALGLYAYNGVNYGVPRDAGIVGFWYNTDLFTQAGIDAPPATWDELVADIQLLKDAGITPIAVGAGDKWPGAFWWEYLAVRVGGKAAFDAAYSRTGAFTDEPFVQAGVLLQELVAMDAFQPGFLAATWGDEAIAMANGNAAMDLMGQWAPGAFRENSADGTGLDGKLGWFPFPAIEGGAGGDFDSLGGGNGFVVGINAEPEAVDFLKFISSVDSQTAQAEIGMSVPVVAGAEVGLTDAMLLKVQAGLAQADYFQLYYDQYLPPAVGSVVNDSVAGLFANTLTPEQAAQAIDDSYAAELP
jgi:raffinose/stachyose/melibiose transport system substrate-binding protein